MKIYEITPSSLFANINIGQIFVHQGSNKAFMLLDRDVVKVYAVRWTWLDDFLWTFSKKRMAFESVLNKVREQMKHKHEEGENVDAGKAPTD